MKALRCVAFGATFCVFTACGAAAPDANEPSACQSDPSMCLTGTESEPLVGANGVLSCPATKDLICHYPPGNRANAHSICVGPPAWPPHRRLHGDTLGPCEGVDGGAGNGSSDAGSSSCGSGHCDAGSGAGNGGGGDAGAAE
jgi:hypothetical protein